MQVHCYRYGLNIAHKWIKLFPNSYFGLTPEICGKRCSAELLEVFDTKNYFFNSL